MQRQDTGVEACTASIRFIELTTGRTGIDAPARAMAAVLRPWGFAVSSEFAHWHLDAVLSAVALAVGVARPEVTQPSRLWWLPAALVPVSAAVVRLLIDPASLGPSLVGAMAAGGLQPGGIR